MSIDYEKLYDDINKEISLIKKKLEEDENDLIKSSVEEGKITKENIDSFCENFCKESWQKYNDDVKEFVVGYMQNMFDKHLDLYNNGEITKETLESDMEVLYELSIELPKIYVVEEEGYES